MKNKPENLKAMLKQRIKELDKALMNFDPAQHLTYAQFDEYLDEVYKPVTVGGRAFLASKVLFQLDYTAYFEDFRNWADTVDYTQIAEYNQLQDEREMTLDWLMELEQ